MIIVTRREYFDEWNNSVGTTKPKFNVGDKIKCEIDFYSFRAAQEKRLIFDSATKTITNGNNLDSSSFIVDGEIEEGDQIAITGTASNNHGIGSYLTVSNVTARVITVTGALVNETAEDANIYAATPFTRAKYFFNVMADNGLVNFESLTDKGTLQRYCATGISASNLTPINMKVDTDSFGWVSSELTDEETGETDQVTIVGDGISTYQQKFMISHTFIVAPVITQNYFSKFVSNINTTTSGGTVTTPPDYIPANYFFDIQNGSQSARKNQTTWTIATDTGSELIAWFNQNTEGARPDYYVYSSSVKEAGGDALDSIDIGKECEVTILVKSRSGSVLVGDKISLNIMWSSLAESDYVATMKTLLGNFWYDRAFAEVEFAAPINGEQYGTDRQSLKSIVATKQDDSTVKIVFNTLLSDALKAVMESRDELNRYFLIWVGAQPQSIVSSDQDVRVSTYVFGNAVWDKTDAELFGFTESGILAYAYPDELTNGAGSIEGFVGDPYYTRTPFWIESAVENSISPTVKSIKVQVVAVKEGYSDFVLEEKSIDCSSFRKLLDVQQLSLDDERGFITYEDDPRNRVRLLRASANDDGTKMAYELQYGLALRYEYWRDVFLLNQDGVTPDIFRDIDSVTEEWSNYKDVEGWNLKFRITANVEGYNGFVNEYYSQIDLKASSNVADPLVPSTITGATQFFAEDEEENLTEVGSILTDVTTRIRSTFVGSFVFPSGMTGYYATMFADVESVGGIYYRRFAGSELESEEDSPFSAPEALEDATESYANGNVRINIYEGAAGVYKIIAEAYFDPTVMVNANPGLSKILVYPRVGFKGDQPILALIMGGPLALMSMDALELVNP